MSALASEPINTGHKQTSANIKVTVVLTQYKQWHQILSNCLGNVFWTLNSTQVQELVKKKYRLKPNKIRIERKGKCWKMESYFSDLLAINEVAERVPP